MTKLRVLFNVLEVHDPAKIFPLAKSLGIESISIFGDLCWPELPERFNTIAREFTDVCVNLYHEPTYTDKPGWRESLEKDSERILPALARIGIDNYAWMIECNLYGYPWNPLVGRYVHRDRLVERVNAFHEVAHAVNPRAVVIGVPYPSQFMNLNCGVHGWKDWWVRHGEKMKFDRIAMNAHIGVWIHAPTGRWVYRHLTDAVRFLQKRGYPPLYVEVGYPTLGRKPLIGLYGWGREKDQADLLKTCYRAISDMGVPAMQICEFIDPDPDGQVYEIFYGDKGKLPGFLGVAVEEEAHWGLLRSDGTDKSVCSWIREVTAGTGDGKDE